MIKTNFQSAPSLDWSEKIHANTFAESQLIVAFFEASLDKMPKMQAVNYTDKAGKKTTGYKVAFESLKELAEWVDSQ